MNAFLSRKPPPLVFAPVLPRHRYAIRDLVLDAESAHAHLDWHEIDQWLEIEPDLVRIAMRGPRIVGVLGLSAPLNGACWVRIAAVEAREDTPTLLTALWHELRPALHQCGVDQVAWLLIREWSGSIAARLGFSHVEDIVTLRRAGVGAPVPATTGGLYIRAMQSADLNAITAVDHAAFHPPWQMTQTDLAEASRIAANATVALIDDVIIGYQMSTLYFDGAHLARLAVSPQAQGHRIGTALVEDVLHHFHRRGVQTMTVNTQDSNHISQRLYERHGFRRNGYDLPVWVIRFDAHRPR